MGIKYISKINDKTWKISTTKSGKSVKNFKTEKEAIEYAQQIRSTEAIIIKKGNTWKQYNEKASSSSSKKNNIPKQGTTTKKTNLKTKKTTNVANKEKPKSDKSTTSTSKKSSSLKTKSSTSKNSKAITKESKSPSPKKTKAPVSKPTTKKTKKKKIDVSEEKLNKALKEVAPEIINALENSDIELTNEQKLATKLSKKQPSDIIREQNYMAIALSCFILFVTIGLIIAISWLII